MSDNWIKVDFKLSVKHVGFKADFYHEQSDSLELPEATAAEYEQAQDTSSIFVQNRDGVAFSEAEMLVGFLKKSNTTLQDHVPEQEIKIEGATWEQGFPINFTKDSFHMITDQGPVDLKRLTLLLELSLKPPVH